VNQRHSCGGAGDRDDILSGKPRPLARLYRRLEDIVRVWAGVEIVVRERYALFRTSRIFADLVFTRDALRLAVHLGRVVRDPMFFKVQGGRGRQVAHVTKIRDDAGLRAVTPYVLEAWQFSQSE
jgi:hypothetical protein